MMKLQDASVFSENEAALNDLKYHPALLLKEWGFIFVFSCVKRSFTLLFIIWVKSILNSNYYPNLFRNNIIFTHKKV